MSAIPASGSMITVRGSAAAGDGLPGRASDTMRSASSSPCVTTQGSEARTATQIAAERCSAIATAIRGIPASGCERGTRRSWPGIRRTASTPPASPGPSSSVPPAIRATPRATLRPSPVERLLVLVV